MKDMTRESPAERAVAPPVEKQKKRYKMKDLSRELAAEKAKNIQLMEELEQSQRINEELLANQADREVIDTDFEKGTRLSSTRRTIAAPEAAPNLEESRFYTSINQLSIASVNIPECKPADDGEIHRQSFEAWKDLLVDSMALAGVEEERTMFTIFKVKAGPKLLEIFKNTKSSNEDPDIDYFPFANAMSRLKSYFGSGSDVMLIRRKLALLTQKPDESDLAYITRVGSMARLCEYDDSKEFEQIVATIAEHATNRDVRKAALKMLSRNKCFTDLVDAVREIETIKLNEEYVRKRYRNVEQGVVASVSAAYPRNTNHTANYAPQRGFQHHANRSRGGGSHAPRGRQSYASGGPSFRPTPKERCFRCNSIYHEADVCGHRDKNCDYCGIRGHIQRACTNRGRGRGQGRGMKRQATESFETTAKKIAAIEESKDDLESVDPVSESTEF